MDGSAANPAGALVEPELDEGFEGVKTLNELSEWLSPTYWITEIVGEVCTLLFGTPDPVESIKEQLGGDVEGLARAGVAINHIGECERFIAANLTAAETAMFQRWHGNAAAAAKGYFDNLHSVIDKNSTELIALSQQYRQTALAISSFTTLVVTALESLGDIVIGIAVAVAVGGATFETGIGPALATAAGAVLIVEAIGKWVEIADLVARIAGAANTFLFVASGGGIDTMAQTPLPKSAYDDPQV